MRKKADKQDQYRDREAQKYENPIPSREFILQHLAERGKPATREALVGELDLDTPTHIEALRRRLIAMERDGQLYKNRNGAYGPASQMDLVAGYVIGHKDGFGFLALEKGGNDLFLNARQMRQVFHGDKVLARVATMDSRGRCEASIVKVLEHNTKEIVGRFFLEANTAFVQPVNQRFSHTITIPLDIETKAKNGQMVVVDIVVYPSMRTGPVGRIKEILGDHLAPGLEIDVAIRNHALPSDWSEGVLEEAHALPTTVADSSAKNRVDLRHLPFVTIDGEDAKDFDDAVYCAPQPRGGWLLYVAIADVSHYVKPHSALDKEASTRGNSVYFPGRVLPMLPETLSNGLCSLNPNVNRLVMVCEMTIKPSGVITGYRFYEAIFKSWARLTYNQVFAMVSQDDQALQARYADLLPQLKNLFALYPALAKARSKRGAIDFDMPETKIIFGENRKIEKIVSTQRNDAHRMIEECMLCANICAAQFLNAHEFPGLYRNHEGPNLEKLDDLRLYLKELALTLPGQAVPTPKNYAALIKSIADRPDAHVIQTMLLRSLSQAVYSTKNTGHFGLAYDTYAHFTSPIRRYPDLLVHRAIRSLLNKKSIADSMLSQMESYASHCSMTERRADEATREVVDWLKCEYMKEKVGDIFCGVIANVTNFGLFVELKEVFVEGLIHISHLPDDYYHYDPIKRVLAGEHSGRRFGLGGEVEVRVARVDLDERKIDFVLAETTLEKKPSKLPGNKKSKKTTKSRRLNKR